MKGETITSLLVGLILILVFGLFTIPLIKYNAFSGEKSDFVQPVVGEDTITPILDSLGKQVPCSEKE